MRLPLYFLTVLTLFTRRSKIADKKQNEYNDEYDRTKSVHIRRNAFFGLRVYVNGQRLETVTRREIAYYEIVERQCERHYEPGNNSRGN